MYKRGYLEDMLGRNLSGKQKCPLCKRFVSTLFAKTDLNQLTVIYVCWECNALEATKNRS